MAPIYTIPAAWPFARQLAAGMLAEIGDDPLALSAAMILLPTRRACRTVREAFLTLTEGRPLLLPRLVPVGDLDADELLLGGEAGIIAPLGEHDEERADDGPGDGAFVGAQPVGAELRRMLLATLILARDDLALTHDQALRLAGDLGRLVDEVATERLAFDRLGELAPPELADHWQATLHFLEIITEAWPAILGEGGLIDPARHRDLLLIAQAKAWAVAPPSTPIWLAGVTGAIPAVADLAAMVSTLPQGRVILPGFDSAGPADAAIAEDTHPQGDMLRLLQRLSVEPMQVRPWPTAPSAGTAVAAPERSVLLREVFRPAAESHLWQETTTLDTAAVDGISVATLPDERQEATAIALLLREALETPARTAMLVTPDRGLARRVATIMDRWGVEVDDSAGIPLDQTPRGIFLRLVADAAFHRLSPLKLLALAKHPLCRAGMEPGGMRRWARIMDKRVLRGPAPPSGPDGLAAAVAQASAGMPDALRSEVEAGLDRLRRCLDPFLRLIDGNPRPLDTYLVAHLTAAEALAATPDVTGAETLWSDEDGGAAAQLLCDVREAAAGLRDLPGERYPQTFDVLLTGPTIRPPYRLHPRLQILGPLEARLQQADLVIIGGVNEQVWPAATGLDPWMSRPMRKAFGLPSRDRGIGRAAHDLAQAMAAPRVILTRAARIAGTPTVRSRWLLRMEAVLPPPLREHVERGGRMLQAWVASLDTTPRESVPAPEPVPPTANRPTALYVTRIETLLHDPYAIYARFVLGLEPLDPLEAEPGPRERGTVIHDALDKALRDTSIDWTDPDASLPALITLGEQAFAELGDDPEIRAFWLPRFNRAAAWFCATEAERRRERRPMLLEAKGSWIVPGSDPPFRISAKADRIDRSDTGGLAVIDYKTGAPPSLRAVREGRAPQLSLEALIAQDGGFEDQDAPADVTALEYWQLSGGAEAGKRTVIRDGKDPSLSDALFAADAGVRRLIAYYQQPDTPYRSHVRAHRYGGDYDHLARVKEWAAGEGGEEDDE